MQTKKYNNHAIACQILTKNTLKTVKNTSFECILVCHQMQHLKKFLFSKATKSPFFQNFPTSFENHQRPHSNYIISTTLSKIFILLSSFHVLYWWRIFSPLFCYFFTKSKKKLDIDRQNAMKVAVSVKRWSKTRMNLFWACWFFVARACSSFERFDCDATG